VTHRVKKSPNKKLFENLVRIEMSRNRTSVTEDFVTEQYELDPTSGYQLTATGGLDGVVGTGNDDAIYNYDIGHRP